MNLFRRLSATMVSRVDDAVRGIENHDAVVGVSLDDLRRAIAETRVRQRRIETAFEQQLRERDRLSAEATKWRDRARSPETDEATALECVRRARGCDQRVAALDREIEGQRSSAAKLSRALERLERRHRELESQRRTLRGRDAAAQANRTAEHARAAESEALQETLDRWEIEITAGELADPAEPGADDLADCFDAVEEQSDLRAELAALRNESREG